MTTLRQLYSTENSQFSQAIISYAPISYYLLNETVGNTAFDKRERENLTYPSVGVNNILNQSSLLSTGKGKSVQFNSSSNLTQLIGNHTFLSSNVTIGALIRINSNLILGRVFGFSLLLNGLRAEIELYIGATPNLNGAGNFLVVLSQNVNFYNSTTKLFLNDLNFVCLTLNSSTFTLYVNGVNILSGSTTGSNLNSANNQNKFYLGYTSGVGVNSFNLSDVFICNYALTNSQINNINSNRY
jgi:hypothetical protein